MCTPSAVDEQRNNYQIKKVIIKTNGYKDALGVDFSTTSPVGVDY